MPASNEDETLGSDSLYMEVFSTRSTWKAKSETLYMRIFSPLMHAVTANNEDFEMRLR